MRLSIKREKYSIAIKSTSVPPSFSFRWTGRPFQHSSACVDFRLLSKLSSSCMGRFVDFLYIFRKTGI